MIVSLVYQVTRRLLSVPAVLLRDRAGKDAELLVLRHENAVLRRQLVGRGRHEWADRLWFAALSSLIPEGCLYCRTVADLGLFDCPSMGMLSDRGSATALPDLLPTSELPPLAGPIDRREQRRDPRASP